GQCTTDTPHPVDDCFTRLVLGPSCRVENGIVRIQLLAHRSNVQFKSVTFDLNRPLVFLGVPEFVLLASLYPAKPHHRHLVRLARAIEFVRTHLVNMRSPYRILVPLRNQSRGLECVLPSDIGAETSFDKLPCSIQETACFFRRLFLLDCYRRGSFLEGEPYQ